MPNSTSLSVGRLTLLAPSGAVLQFSKAVVTDISVQRVPLTPPENFASWTAQRSEQIRAGKLSSGREDALIRNISLGPTLPAAVFWTFPKQNAQTMEAYRDFGSFLVLGSTQQDSNEQPISERLMTAVINGFHPSNNEAGAANGFAVEGGIVERPFENNEVAESTATFSYPADGSPTPLHCKLDIITHVYANAAPSTLPQRVRRAEAAALMMQKDSPGASLKTFRKGPRTVAGVKGDEAVSLLHVPENPPDAFLGEFEFGGDANNPVRPYVQVKLTVEVPAAVNPQTLLALWDALLQSARFHQ